MSPILYQFPAKAKFGRVIPKSKIYEHASSSTRVKEHFVKEVERIVWKYKLAPETINLTATKAVPEIQVFRVVLKGRDLSPEVLFCIDKAIPLPIVFELHRENDLKLTCCYKRPSEAEQDQWVCSGYFCTDWMAKDIKRQELPVVLNLSQLYEKLLEPALGLDKRGDESLQDRVERLSAIRQKEREIEKCNARLQNEKQFNKKVEINSEIKRLQAQLLQLTGLPS